MKSNILINDLDLPSLPSPCFVVNEQALRENLEILKSVKDRTGCTILLALKGFAMFSAFPLIREYLDGVCASSPDEARLGREEFGKQVHSCAPAYSAADIRQLTDLSDHIVFNSFNQWEKYKKQIPDTISCGLRINPGYSEVSTAIYNPCAPHSRLGIQPEEFGSKNLTGISGLHFHTMCEQNSDTLKRTLAVIEEKFAPYLEQMKWINFGGGHHITRPDYGLDTLCGSLNRIRETYKAEVILEPGEAVALNTGVLVSTVLDIVHNQTDIAILDTSAATHMPDVLEMPYRPEIIGAGQPGEKKHTYRLGGITCLAGDIIGEYSFDEPLEAGSKIVLCDMAHYSMVKTNTFNGVRLPSIAIDRPGTGVEVIRTFGYGDYRNRLS